MSPNFQVDFKMHNGDLYVRPRGVFDGSSAFYLVRMLKKKYNGHGGVVIDTRLLRTIVPFGCSVFQDQIHQCRIPSGKLSFTGEKGHELALEGCNIVTPAKPHRHTCSGKYSNCRCKKTY
jgi:hypothetical protein